MASLLIGVDASRAVRPNRTGTENYSWYVLKELLRQDKRNRYRFYAPHLPKEEFGDYPNLEWRLLPARRLWSQVELSKELRHNPPDVLFVPSHVIPLFSTVKSVVTLHDVAYKYFPQSYSSFDRQYMNFTAAVSLSKASRILVPCQATKDDLIKVYHADPQKITVTHLSYDKDAYNNRRDYGPSPLESPYIYFVGRIEERKNVAFLVEAFALLAKEAKPVLLVLAGKSGYGFERVQKTIADLPPYIRERILQPGFLNNDENGRYLKHAKLFAFPSLYEGFGIPCLEAMAVGTPVVCTNRPPLPEVVEDAAVTLEPTNPLTWAAAMSRVLHQSNHAQELVRKGLKQVEKFSWEKCAAQTLQVLEDVGRA